MIVNIGYCAPERDVIVTYVESPKSSTEHAPEPGPMRGYVYSVRGANTRSWTVLAAE